MTDVFHQLGVPAAHLAVGTEDLHQGLFGGDHRQAVVPVSEMLESFERRFGRHKALAVHYIWEDLWWKRRDEHIPWLEELIRL